MVFAEWKKKDPATVADVQKVSQIFLFFAPGLSYNISKYTLLLLIFAGTIFCQFLRFGKNRKI